MENKEEWGEGLACMAGGEGDREEDSLGGIEAIG